MTEECIINICLDLAATLFSELRMQSTNAHCLSFFIPDIKQGNIVA